MALIKAFITNLAVLAIGYATEYLQFGELQFDRECDEVVWCVYFIILFYLFLTQEGR